MYINFGFNHFMNNITTSNNHFKYILYPNKKSDSNSNASRIALTQSALALHLNPLALAQRDVTPIQNSSVSESEDCQSGQTEFSSFSFQDEEVCLPKRCR